MHATSSNALSGCSAYSGHGAIGTPCHRLSSTEFQPQWVTKPPTAAWARISSCGAQPGHTTPWAFVLSRNPSGSRSPRFASVGCPEPLPAGGPRSTHRNLCPLRSRPAATSRACSAFIHPMLPKQRNTTDAGGCASSHRMHSCADDDDRASTTTRGFGESTGPIGYTVGARPPGVHLPPAMDARTPGSSSAAVLAMMPLVSRKRRP
uniref:Uncharacterized protein n=1 Tax=Zea mays TaxID=4577 RepID=B4FRC7_MAIZE|nr:unknown [Zea mays]ACG28697.1 hypothetical protein [Zea mays]|eukprot:NP_001143067.1 uncharacterized protein LOC100275539 [Zea mays]